MKQTPTLIKRNHHDNIKFMPRKMAVALERLYEETSPERMRLDADFKRVFSTEELIEGAYKQAGYETTGNKP